jgi:hypothetical protein
MAINGANGALIEVFIRTSVADARVNTSVITYRLKSGEELNTGLNSFQTLNGYCWEDVAQLIESLVGDSLVNLEGIGSEKCFIIIVQ